MNSTENHNDEGKRRKRTSAEVARLSLTIGTLAFVTAAIIEIASGLSSTNVRAAATLLGLLLGLMVILILTVFGYIAGIRVDRRLEWFSANRPHQTAFAIANQIGFREALADLSVENSESMSTAVVTADTASVRLWTGYHPPRCVLEVPRERIHNLTRADAYFGGINQRDRGALLIETSPGVTVDLPLYFQGHGLRAFVFVPRAIVQPSIDMLRRSLRMG